MPRYSFFSVCACTAEESFAAAFGVLAKTSGIAYEKWIDTIKTTVPEKFLEINLKAFNAGYNL